MTAVEVVRQNYVLGSVRSTGACYSSHKVKMRHGERACDCLVPPGSHAELVDRKMMDEGAADRWAAIGFPLVAVG